VANWNCSSAACKKTEHADGVLEDMFAENVLPRKIELTPKGVVSFCYPGRNHMPKSGPNEGLGWYTCLAVCLTLLAVGLMMVSSAATLSGAQQPRLR